MKRKLNVIFKHVGGKTDVYQSRPEVLIPENLAEYGDS